MKRKYWRTIGRLLQCTLGAAFIIGVPAGDLWFNAPPECSEEVRGLGKLIALSYVFLFGSVWLWSIATRRGRIITTRELRKPGMV